MKINYRELKQSIRLIQLLARIGWKSTEGRGDQLRGPCPLAACVSCTSTDSHGRRRRQRDFSMNDAKNVFRCFRCGAAGNVLGFWQAYRQTTREIAANELHQILATSNCTTISNQPKIPQPDSSQPAKLADS